MSEARVSIIFDGDSAAAAASARRLAEAIDRLSRAERDEAASASAAAAAEKARTSASQAGEQQTRRRSRTEQDAVRAEMLLRRQAEAEMARDFAQRDQRTRNDIAMVRRATTEMERDFTRRRSLMASFSRDAQRTGRDMDVLGRSTAALGRGVGGISAMGAALGGLAAVVPALLPLVGLMAEFPAAIGAMAGALGTVKLLGLDDISKAASQVEKIQARMHEIQQQEDAGLIKHKAAVSELAKEQIKLNNATAGLSGPQKQALVLWQQYQKTFEGLGEQVQARILPSFKHLAGALAENGGLIRSFFTNSASVIGENLDKFAAIAQTPLFKKEFGALIRESTGALDGFLSVGLKLGQAFGGIATAIEPAQHALGQLVEHLATMFAVWAQGAGQSQLQSFFGAMVRSLTIVGSLLAHVGQALGHVFIDAYPASVRLVQGVDRLFQSFDRFVSGHGAGISGVFNGIADSLGAIEHWVEANQTSIGTILSSAFTIARTAATGFEDALKLIAPALSSLLTILAPLASALASVSTALGGLGSLAALGTAVVAVTALRGALVGLRAAMAGIAGAGALAGAGEALAGLLSPTTAIIAALVGAGALWAAFSGGVRNAGAAAQDSANKLNDLRDAVRGLRDAQAGALGATQAHKDAVWAYNDSVRATREAVANLANVEKDEHATAQQLRDAHERVTAAYRARADAATQVKITSSELANADEHAADANHKVAAGARAAASAFAAADAEARHSAQAVETAANAARAGHQAWKIHADAAAQDAQAARVAKAALDAYVASNAAATGPMSAVNQALADLATKLGRIPPKKLTEVAVNIIQHGGTLGDVIAQINAIRSKTVDITANIHNHASTDAAHKARGGFIRGPANAGDTIPIYVTPGEVVLNRSQQAVVGHGRIAAALGGAASHFSAGMGYAKGKKPPATPKTHHAASISPSRLKSPRYPSSVDPDSKLGKALSGVKDALMDVETASQTGSDDDKRYSNLARQYDIEAPNLTQTIPDPGNPGGTIDVRDEQGISARTRQLSDLIGLKNTIISDMDAQRDLMNRAIARLKAALEQLAEAIVTAHENLKEERKKAAELDRNAKTNRSDATSNEDKGRAISDQIATEKQKKKPDQKRIDTLEDQRRGFYNTAHAQRERAQQDEAASQQHSQNAGRLEGRLRELQDTQSDYTQKVGDLSATITHQMPFDRQGLVLDVEELQKQQRDVAATQSQAPSTPGGTGGPSGGPETVPTPGGGDTPGGGGGGGGGDNSGLLAQIGALKLALAVQGAQLPILGSFRSGALHVPQDGVAMLHAGEKVIRPGVRDSAGSGGDSKLAVELHLKDQLGDFVDARVLKVAGPLIVQMGNQAEQRRREGRFSAR